ncbi:allose ABC transporter ATP-binding protein [Pasteurella multocida]|uniref:D-allose ABC transporter ATP-binding protein AlsA n=1 Tax=Pasteurella multocida TaxID=747 RepID=UPI0007434094|nr:D-allose ABC transporter ATP-binding protein AlsA [Pasteurella multocida]KUM14916.1 allose ABC transporter ATP-binding protein [Pasteurella multocida]MBM2608769.1 D-allose ABC transporter ATP-binding protein AlsA [Pasteurella multocida]MCL7758297.1 D-allose ABC transporter ATP-binding protein AlsA [Pasteurella multocida]MCL7821279.1 D-allose ABC transporter ATP-binding protein AlsA [Pasteurella multocida]MCL7821756.1 D-allose ABC transporter ATP-binding protein AlsA [Pasteurella multocida]
MSQILVQMRNISKHFGVVKALDKVNMDIYSHEIHALLGENGAGKSTLMKLLSGLHRPTSGSIAINERQYEFLDHKVAAELGIGIIYQELSLIDELSVLENLFIGRLLTKKVLGISIIDWDRMRSQAVITLLRLGLKIDLDEKVSNLSISYKQMIEIAKVLISDVKIIIMDEPTSSLTNAEIEYLFFIMKQLKKDGKAIVYISHKMNEIRKICERYTILKDGKSVASGNIQDITNDQIIKLMVGREIESKFINTGKVKLDDIIFEVKGVTSKNLKQVNDVSFSLYRGEILGFSGLVGSGRTELMNCLFGVDRCVTGKIYLDGKEISPKSPLDAIKKGMAYITENRRGNGFFHNFSIKQNIVLSKSLKDGGYKGAIGLFNHKYEQECAEQQKSILNIKCASIEQNIMQLSGGNQQKVIIGKWMVCEPNVIIFDEPTRGIDIGAKTEIYKIMRQLAQQGKAILMVSSELPEIMAVCDRIAVFREGKITRILENNTALTEEEIMRWALPQD